jgi:hypothetical protein
VVARSRTGTEPVDGMTARRQTPTQLERVARALERYGRVAQTDFDLPTTVDGLSPIRRVASRITDLRNAGWVIDGRERRDAMAVYRLVSRPPSATCDAEPHPQPAEPLFVASVTRSPSPYDDLEAA